MSRRILLALLAFLLLASVAIPAVSAEEKEVKNLLGMKVGNLVLKGYFNPC